ncbi:Protein BOI2 [Trichoderma ghanense]|uniref:Protein BOI2 n=1 Tax=Trichoderma ghanense TaxID=65468 RepID=A0ABY2H8H5_9HYPO
MASRAATDGAVRPDVGDLLMVIHDFIARSSDELSLKKGDRVELLERDDEFGDGWFLGRHMTNNNTGLFPEVYTRPTPRAVSNPASTPAFMSSQPLSPLVEVTQEASLQATPIAHPSASSSAMPLSSIASPSALPAHLMKTESAPVSGLGGTGSPVSALDNSGQDEFLSETLNVINEHITHLQSPPGTSAGNTAATDSGSEYSVAIDHRMSYIQGEETDEEEEAEHSRAEVEAWSPDDVAEYLFTEGVEKHHCEVFRDQEISGEVLLSMDQSSLFIKDFDLGSVGRRLKTWQKIKALQDMVGGDEPDSRRATHTRGSDGGSEDAKRTRSRTSTLTGNSISSRPTSVQARRLSLAQSSNKASPAAHITPTNGAQESPSRTHVKRPSAASIRDLNHSRRHSSTEFRLPGSNATVPKVSANANLSVGDGVHKKQPSFDRNWTLGGAVSQTSQRPLSSTGLQEMLGTSEPELQDSAVELDRGYFSGTEVYKKGRNVLRKRDSANHGTQQSYADEQRVRSATALSRHSRYGSVDSFRDGAPSAAQKYYGIQASPHRRNASTNTTDSVRPPPPAKDGPAPAVTNLDTMMNPALAEPSPVAGKGQGLSAGWLSSVTEPVGKATRPAMRAISDKLTFERSKGSGSADLSTNEPPIPSPVRTGSSTASAGQSLELESHEALKSPVTATAPANKKGGKKGKKETSAYTQGLLKIPPAVAMKDADYYGWMKKKSSNLMTTWKPRFFVLKGRRLAYYYSEEDDQEKGLIDISFHRVLPADNERLTGLHATLTGAAGGSIMPSGHTPAGDDGLNKGDDSMFIFKLVPPRAGLSKGVSFTKPTVHYFAVPNLKQGRLWMAALMKSTIERDDTQPITTTYQQKTISLAKAKQMRHRPPGFEDAGAAGAQGGEAGSGVSGMDKQLAALKIDGARLDVNFGDKDSTFSPLSA